MGKKLSSRQRKDLDEVSEKTGVNLRSCRYVFSKLCLIASLSMKLYHLTFLMQETIR